MTKISCLDKGFVQLMRCADSDLDVVNAARVSFDKESRWETEEKRHYSGSLGGGCTVSHVLKLSDKDTKLIHYLAEHNHWSPFSHPQIRFRIKAPIFVRTQLFKHKVGAVENEVSRRYVDAEPEFYEPDVWRGRPDGSVKQGSGGEIEYNDTVRENYHVIVSDVYQEYECLLKYGVAPEMARMVLPQSTYTEWIWTGSLAFFARVYNQRSDPHAQLETQQFAHAIGEIMSGLFPVSWEALTGG